MSKVSPFLKLVLAEVAAGGSISLVAGKYGLSTGLIRRHLPANDPRRRSA